MLLRAWHQRKHLITTASVSAPMKSCAANRPSYKLTYYGKQTPNARVRPESRGAISTLGGERVSQIGLGKSPQQSNPDRVYAIWWEGERRKTHVSAASQRNPAQKSHCPIQGNTRKTMSTPTNVGREELNPMRCSDESAPK
jgi:hypothetical protein